METEIPAPTLDFHRQLPMVVAVDMGYGHLRAARPLARALSGELVEVDRPPLVGAEERKIWDRVRGAYEWTSRISQIPVLGRPFGWLLEAITDIPHLYPYRDLSAPTRGVLTLERMMERGLGRGLVERLRETGAPLLATFYSPAIAADRAGLNNVFCVITDSDINRVWVPLEPERTNIHYLVPSQRAGRRLRSYGVPAHRITFTGFPLPHELVGGARLGALRRNLAARLVRLDPSREFRRAYREELAQFLGPLPPEEEGKPPLLAFAVGGAGAQAGMARQFLPSLRPAVEEGRLRVTLIAGVRPEVAARFREAIAASRMEGALGHGLEILEAASPEQYFERFDLLMARTDILWTKPSELTFYGALGLPLLFAAPVGVHERYNRRWARDAGAGLAQREVSFTWQWLADWLDDGTLAGAAWSGFTRLPKHGLYQILDVVGRPSVAAVAREATR
jgi:UDP-N-acetylglucosamine:LPS N-acetylglucosamine transferase